MVRSWAATACSAVCKEISMTTVPMDSEKLKDMRFDTQGVEAVARDVLVTIPYTYPRRTEITVSTEEFSAVCPWSGLPDYAKLTIRYLPSDRYVELKSLKYYVVSFRFSWGCSSIKPWGVFFETSRAPSTAAPALTIPVCWPSSPWSRTSASIG